jgi:hypothetical protein
MRNLSPQLVRSKVPAVAPFAAPSREPADRHDAIARRIRRLGTGSRYNCVERFIIERESLAREVELLGNELAEDER